jgi:3-methyladenine DNA glycosylase AlkC
MAEPFKNLIGPAVVRTMAAQLQQGWPAFDRRRFERVALAGLDGLEMKARAMQIATALEATLPRDFDLAAAVLDAGFIAGLEGWGVWGVGEYIARRGQHAPKRALALLRTMTPRFTAEWAIRPFILQHPELAFATLQGWCTDPNEQVRRLVSEGSRPRLPWGLQLKPLIADPSPTLPLLEALQDDPSEAVRRSVANHLNDIAKDHPALIADWIERHLTDAPPDRRALLRHACRTLIKRGDTRVLLAWGVGEPLRGSATLSIAPRRATLGDSVLIEVLLQPRGRRSQRLAIDYAVHHVKANGGTSAKVFKGWMLELAADEPLRLAKRHALKAITTRRYFGGRHRVELMINGRVVAEAAFELRV